MAFQRNAHRTAPTARTSVSAAANRPGPSRDGEAPRSPSPERRFDLFDPDAPPPPKPSRAHLFAIPLFITALFVVAFVRSLAVRALLPLALAAAAVALLVQRSRGRSRARREGQLRRGLLLRAHDLRFKPGRGDLAKPVLDRTQPFGATLLSTHRRDRLVLLLTSERGVFHVGTTVDAAPARGDGSPSRAPSARNPALESLLSRSTTVAGEDSAFESIGPDGQPMLLAPRDFAAFIDALCEDDPGCLDRLIVTDTKGAPVVLDDGELRVDRFAFDLTAPLEWRALVFQEPFGQVMTLYQGTWIRQNGSEVVLVSLLPSLGPILEVEPGEIATLDRAVLRDLRLMQASAETPPPREQRHAIERLLMMPIRSSLDRAPRKSRQPTPRRTPLH